MCWFSGRERRVAPIYRVRNFLGIRDASTTTPSRGSSLRSSLPPLVADDALDGGQRSEHVGKRETP